MAVASKSRNGIFVAVVSFCVRWWIPVDRAAGRFSNSMAYHLQQCSRKLLAHAVYEP